jgi:hypothetical protein
VRVIAFDIKSIEQTYKTFDSMMRGSVTVCREGGKQGEGISKE